MAYLQNSAFSFHIFIFVVRVCLEHFDDFFVFFCFIFQLVFNPATAVSYPGTRLCFGQSFKNIVTYDE